MNPKNIVRYMGGVICTTSTIDQATQNISAFNIIEQINVEAKRKDLTKPIDLEERIVIPVNFQIITSWKRTNTSDLGKEVNAKIQTELMDNEGTVLSTAFFDLPIPATALRSRYILNVQGLQVTNSGEYRFSFRLVDKDVKSEPIAELYLDVNVVRE